MTDVGEFIEDFLQHEYDPVKAREYYLRTRKLVGRKTRDLTKTKVTNQGKVGAFVRRNGEKVHGDLVFQKHDRPFRKDKHTSKFVPESVDKLNARRHRVLMQEARLKVARAKAKQIKDEKKRRSVEGKIDALQGRLKKALLPNGKPKISKAKPKSPSEMKKGVRNPFKELAGVKISRTKS